MGGNDLKIDAPTTLFWKQDLLFCHTFFGVFRYNTACNELMD